MTVRIAILALAFVVLAILLHAMGVGRIVDLVRRSGWTFAWMVALYSLHIALRGWIIWRNLPSGILSLPQVLRIRFAAEAVEMLTFTGPFLAEPAKGWMFVKGGIALADAAGVIAFEYLTYTLVAADIALVGLGVLLRRGAFPPAAQVPLLALMLCLVLFTAGVIFAALSGIGLLTPGVRALRPLLGASRSEAVALRVASMEAPLLRLLHGRPGRLLETLTAQTAAHALLALEIWLLFRSLGLAVGAADPWIVEGGVKFINTAFVFVPGQIGAAEGVNALIVKALGFPAAVGVTLSLMRRARAYAVASLGVAVAPASTRAGARPA